MPPNFAYLAPSYLIATVWATEFQFLNNQDIATQLSSYINSRRHRRHLLSFAGSALPALPGSYVEFAPLSNVDSPHTTSSPCFLLIKPVSLNSFLELLLQLVGYCCTVPSTDFVTLAAI